MSDRQFRRLSVEKDTRTYHRSLEVDMPGTLKGAIIGCGWFAERHLQAWLRIPEVEIVAAADLTLGSGAKIREKSL